MDRRLIVFFAPLRPATGGAEDFPGTRGCVGDKQSEMAFALGGASAALPALAGLQNRSLAKVLAPR